MIDQKPPGAQPIQLVVVAYDLNAVEAMLREWTTEGLRGELATGRFGQRLTPGQREELEACLVAWAQRALGQMTLRDALLIDGVRGSLVFSLLCVEATRAKAVLAAKAPVSAPGPLTSELLADTAAHDARLSSLVQRAAAERLALAVIDETEAYPAPTNLLALLPRQPAPLTPLAPPFEQPTGWRRRIAVLLAVAGVALLGLPLLLGHIPDHPAGAPLALLTLALLVGIKAGPAGFAGSLCIWLVANLPEFRYGSSLLAILWPALPLIAAGLGLLWFDRRVRAMWGWLRRQIAGDHPS